jgi:hypothetical protein
MEDKNNDGKADVTEIEGKELMLRKVNLVITKMDPQRVRIRVSCFERFSWTRY